MFVMDPSTMRAIDAAAIESGVPGHVLMERAGAGAARALLQRGPWLWGTTLVVCGRGNNGGDGLVVARLLAGEGRAVRVLLLDPPERHEGDAARNLERCREQGVPLKVLGEDPGKDLRAAAAAHPGRAVVDAILGTGFHPPLKGRALAAVEAVNDLGRRVVALDAPTGLDCSSGAVDPTAVRADLTVTFGFPKWGLYLPAGRPWCGRIETVDLDFPLDLVRRLVGERDDCALHVQAPLAASWTRPRPVDAHKYDVGSLLVVGGSRGMSGAVILNCLGALRAGCGLVEAVVPGSQRLAVDGAAWEVLVHPAAETGEGGLSPEAGQEILERAGRHPAVLLGGGMGPDLATARLVVELVEGLGKPLVVDADGLNAFSRLQRPFRPPEGSVITPHSGELSRLVGCSKEDLEERRVETVQAAARELGCVLLHKGAPTMVAAPSGAFAVVGSGGCALASAGTGDVLAGVVAARLAAGHEAFEAACLGAWIHGRAGDRVAERTGDEGLLARDLLDEVATAGRELQEAAR